jgi:hypothetical protein
MAAVTAKLAVLQDMGANVENPESPAAAFGSRDHCPGSD